MSPFKRKVLLRHFPAVTCSIFTLINILLAIHIFIRYGPQDGPRLPNGEITSRNCPQWQLDLEQSARHALVEGLTMSDQKKTLVVGIPSVYRKENYLSRTLRSLVEESEEDEREDVVVVVYLADPIPSNNVLQLDFIKTEFEPYIRSGFLQVIMAPPQPSFYPSMEFAHTYQTFGDPIERVMWRARQVIDFSFLFSYVHYRALGEYFLILEDDILTSYQYITAIKDFIRSRRKPWGALKFSRFIIIGLLVRTEVLSSLNQFLWIFYESKPVDMLIRDYITLKDPEHKYAVRRIPSLFQHVGTSSTLRNKLQPLNDTTFTDGAKKFRHKNPPANLTTSMKVRGNFHPGNAYQPYTGLFFAAAKENDTLDIVFPSPIHVSRIVLSTGMEAERKERPRHFSVIDAVLEVSSVQDLGNISSQGGDIQMAGQCEKFRKLKRFIAGKVDYRGYLTNVKCIRMRIGRDQKPPDIVIPEIQVFT